MTIDHKPFGTLLKRIVDNRGKTCPTAAQGIPLIATNCISNERLFPQYRNVRFVSQETYKNWFRGHPEPGDMIFVTKGTPGRVCWVPNPVEFCIAQDMVSIQADDAKVYPKYLFAALRSSDLQREIEGLHVGTLIPHFKKGDFNELQIPIPNYNFQRYIGDQYFDISLKIDILHRQNATLEAMAETLFRQWFVEEAKEEWEVTILEKHVETFRGLSYKGSGLTEKGMGLPMHNLNSVYEGGGYKYEGIKFYSGEYKNRHRVYPGDIIVTNTEQGHEFRLIGFPAIVPDSLGQFGLFSQHLFKLTPLESSYLTNEFIFYLLMSSAVREQIISATNGSTVNMLAMDGLQRPEFRLPPKLKVKEFTAIVRNYWSKKELNQKQIQTITNLRDTLLPKLMSGEVRVRDVDIKRTVVERGVS